MSLDILLEEVKDERTFLEFIKELRKDRLKEDDINIIDGVGAGKYGWQNHDIASFLEASVAWAEDSGFTKTQELESEKIWKKCALFLYLGKLYE